MSIFGTPRLAGSSLGSGTSAVSAPVQVNVGDLIVVLATSGNASGTTCAIHDTALNSFTVVGSPNTNGGSAGSVFLGYCLAATNGNATDVITGTFNGNSFSLLFVWVVPLSGGSAQFDADSLAPDNTSHNTPTAQPLNTTGTDEIVFFVATNVFTGFSYTQESGWTLDSSGYASGTGGAQHIQFSSTQTGLTPFMTSSGSSPSTVGVGAFKALVVDVQSLSLVPSSVTFPTTSTATVTLNTAPATNTVVTLGSSDTTVATVPATVTVLAGHTTATFTVSPKNKTGSSTISATLVSTVTAVLNVTKGASGSGSGNTNVFGTTSTPYIITGKTTFFGTPIRTEIN
jgi:trimeric autotransporter adhesin